MQDFFKHQAEWLKTWQEQQQQLTKQYASWGEDLTKGFANTSKQQVPANFEELLKTQQALFEQFTSFGSSLQQSIQQAWGDKLPAELLKQFNFNLLQEFYKSWLGNMKFPGGMQNPFVGGQNWADPSSFLNNFMKQENPFFSTFCSNSLIDELQKMFNMFGMQQGFNIPGGDHYSQLFTNFQGLFNQLASTGTSQGFDKLLETFSNWKEQTDKYLLAPQVGINRESAQDFSKAISLSLDFIESFASMSKLIEETARKSGNRFQAKLVERSLNNEPPIKFSDFCSLWTKENESVFLEVFGSEEFAKTQGEFTAAGFRLKLQMNTLIEKVLDQTPIALKRDVDLAAQEILQLKRELRKSRKHQQELATEAKIAQDAAAASEQRFQKLEATLANLQALAEDKTAQDAITASEQRLQELETALAKIQDLAEPAEKVAKSAPAKPSKPAAKSTVATTKKAPAKKATSTRSTKTSSRSKKPAGTSAE